jgi:hypothetical protein
MPAEILQRTLSSRGTGPQEALNSLLVMDRWVTWKGQRMLWLPPHFVLRLAVHDSTLALSTPDSTIGFAEFDFSRITDAADRGTVHARAAISSYYKWESPTGSIAMNATLIQRNGVAGGLVLCLALCWGLSSSRVYRGLWVLLLAGYMLYLFLGEEVAHRFKDHLKAERKKNFSRDMLKIIASLEKT